MRFLDGDYFKTLRSAHSSYAKVRREVIAFGGSAQTASKRAIFALHRDDFSGADALLDEAGRGFSAIRAIIDEYPEVRHEGSYRAALEEYIEAVLYRNFIKEGRIGPIDFSEVRYDIYLGGLADAAGELQRRQVRLATEGDSEGALVIKEVIAEIVEEMLTFDLSGYLRTKFDQAKNALRRAEDVAYEITIRRSS